MWANKFSSRCALETCVGSRTSVAVLWGTTDGSDRWGTGPLVGGGGSAGLEGKIRNPHLWPQAGSSEEEKGRNKKEKADFGFVSCHTGFVCPADL